MKLIKGKCCHKCGSNSVYLDYDDPGGWCEHCFLCGYTVPLDEVKTVKENEASWPNDVSIEV